MKKHPQDCLVHGALVGGLNSEQRIAIIEEEKKTHRHLGTLEELQVGDVYGGKDWGFLFTITEDGSKGTQVKPGSLAQKIGMGYRPRRPKQ